VAHPHEHVRWLIVADWLDDHGFADRAELLRLHRMMIDTCCEPDQHPERAAWQARIVELIDQGVKPCVPQHTLMLPGGVPLVGNFIPPGSFLMGGEVDEVEQPVHEVELTNSFFVGIYPITQPQWAAVMGHGPSHFRGDRRPVECVSWYDALRFCSGLTELVGAGVRLLTEAEWEFACRAGTTTEYHFGDIPSTERMNYRGSATWKGSVEGEYRRQTIPVDTFPPNPWGLFDCHGNVWEWCADSYSGRGFYATSPKSDPLNPPGTSPWRIFRGGGWDYDPAACASSSRNWSDADRGDNSISFRVAFMLT
jgi:uncharacterized protein (TIGR02996 family)